MKLKSSYVIVAGLFVIQAIVLFLFTQPLICTCGYIKIWEGDIHSAGLSQHFSDWYTFSHIIHGFIFYAILWYLFPKRSFVWRLAIAVGIEAAWEIAENTPMVIQHYRQQALAAGYTGDSIFNSLSDNLAMISGFLFASRVRTAIVVVIAIAMELFTLYFIRDNLTLNVVNLIHVIPSINAWQAGA